MMSRNRKISQYQYTIPKNVEIRFEPNYIIICNPVQKYELPVFVDSFFDIKIIDSNLIIKIKPEQRFVRHAQMMLITFGSKMRHQLKGVSELYKGVINIKGLGYSVNVTKKNNKFHLFFRFGFKDTCNYIMPPHINIENWETAKIHLNISTYSLELLNLVKRNIQRLRMPKVYKLQGIYLDNYFPKVKKYVK